MTTALAQHPVSARETTMTTYETRTAEFGKITFTAPAAGETYRGYVWIETENGYASKGRRQICHGGGFTGSTIQSNAAELKGDAQRWLRQRRRWQRAEGL